MEQLSTAGIDPIKKIFHNEWIDVYPSTLSFEEIHYWPENNRTLFTFERLEAKSGKKLNELTLDEITEFVATEPIHDLSKLAKSISKSGVQVPLIVRDDGKLLDGNRRYFACSWLRMQAEKNGLPFPSVLKKIPVLIIKKSDLSTPVMELKIIAEANFIPDLKVTWPLDAQARAVEAYAQTITNKSESEAIQELADVFGIDRPRVTELLDTLNLTKEFIEQGKTPEEKREKRRIVEGRFVYFWEFRNKGIKGRSGFEGKQELNEVKQVFFDLMDQGKDSPLKNVKQIEPLVQARRDESTWRLMRNSNGENLSLVVAIVNEKKEIRKHEDKIRLFTGWLEGVSDLSPASKNLLHRLSELASQKAREE